VFGTRPRMIYIRMKEGRMSKRGQEWRKCYYCGKFISNTKIQEGKEVKHVFIPDTEYTQEESYFFHVNCKGGTNE
jgi:hypothetical protein